MTKLKDKLKNASSKIPAKEIEDSPPEWPFPTFKGEPTQAFYELVCKSKRDLQIETIKKAKDATF